VGGFNQQSVENNGGVAWAKQVAQSLDPGAIESQVQAYQQAVSKLADVQTTLQNVKNNLAATWTGDAADQAQQSFQASINHAQTTQETITGTVIPALQSAKAAQHTYIEAMAKVPDEKPVPSTNMVESGWDFVTGQATPTQQVQAHNIGARYQSAEALNTLSTSYDTSASQLNQVSPDQDSFTENPNDSAFNLGSVSSSSGDGAASGYRQSVSGGGTTTRSGYVPDPTGTINSGPGPRAASAAPSSSSSSVSGPGSVWTSGSTVTAGAGPTTSNGAGAGAAGDATGPVRTSTGGGGYGGIGVITDEPVEGSGNTFGGNGLGEENPGAGRSGSGSGVFDETGTGDGQLTGGTGTGQRSGGTSSNDGSSLVDDETEPVGSGAGTGEATESATGGGMGGGAGGLGAGEEDLGSSRYSRGRYFDTEENDSPALSRVRSVYEDATDAAGNKLNMMAPERPGTAQGDDEEDERGKRPSYLKEDEFWNTARRIVPPVIE